MRLFNKSKSHTSFEQMIKKYNPALFKHALWMTGQLDLAGDMVQETYFQAWQSIKSLKEEDKALPWLLTILRRAIYREQRWQYRQTETTEHLSNLDNNEHQSDSCDLLDIYTSLEQVSPNHRDIFLLHHLHGFSYDEISQQLDIPKGTVMSRLSRAKEALEKQLNITRSDNVIHIICRQESLKNEK